MNTIYSRLKLELEIFNELYKNNVLSREDYICIVNKLNKTINNISTDINNEKIVDIIL